MKNTIAGVATAGATSILLLLSSAAWAGSSHTSSTTTVFSSFSTLLGPTQPTGQPNQVCGVTTPPGSQPGNSVTAPGSAFNPDGKSGMVYAGTQTQNSKNTASVSQYDVACSKQPPK